MKKFQQLRESSKPVFKKKMGGYPVVISKTPKGYELTIDGDKVDIFKSQKEAESTAKQVLKDLGKLK
jgi:deoxyadenosine/deoxycytidine kinase